MNGILKTADVYPSGVVPGYPHSWNALAPANQTLINSLTEPTVTVVVNK